MMKKILLFSCLLAFAVNVSAQFGLKKTGGNGKGGQLIFTHEEYSNFDAALPNAITEVKDGEKLWMYVKLPKPISSYAYSRKFTDPEGNLVEDVSFRLVFTSRGKSFGKFAEQRVFVKGGVVAEKKGMSINKGYFTYLDSIDLEKTTEIKLCLSSYIRHKSSFVFLKAIGSGEAGKWDTEVKLDGKDENVFATGAITSNMEAGVPQYRKAWTDYENIVNNGDISDNALPPTGKFTDAGVKSAILKEAKSGGIVGEKVVFTQEGWSEYTNPDIYQQKERITHAYVTYKKEGKCMYAMAEIKQILAAGKWGPSLVKLYDQDTPVLCNLTK